MELINQILESENYYLLIAFGLSLTANIFLVTIIAMLGKRAMSKANILVAKKWANRAMQYAPEHLVNIQYYKELIKDFGKQYANKIKDGLPRGVRTRPKR